MKTIFICLLTAFLFSCKGNTGGEIIERESQDTIHSVEVIYVTDTVLISELKTEIENLKDSLKRVTNEITYENYINARRIEKIKYYINITERKPTNQKFFFGWIRRTMSEE